MGLSISFTCNKNLPNLKSTHFPIWPHTYMLWPIGYGSFFDLKKINFLQRVFGGPMTPYHHHFCNHYIYPTYRIIASTTEVKNEFPRHRDAGSGLLLSSFSNNATHKRVPIRHARYNLIVASESFRMSPSKLQFAIVLANKKYLQK